ncbi:MAG: PLP-dependent transferase, partial [Bacteroidota bacterium]
MGVSTNDLYGGSYRIFTKVFANYGIKFHFTDMRDLSNVENLITQNTKMIWVETPTNPTIQIVDVKGEANVLSATTQTPYRFAISATPF